MIRRALPFAVFLSAMGSLSVELAIVRLGAPYVGQSLLPWSAAIASVLIGLTAGHGLGGVVGGEAANRRALRVWLGLVWLGGACGAALMPLLVGQAARIFAGDGGFGPGAVLAVAALAAPPSFAAGFVAPLAVRLAARWPGLDLSRAVGAIYAASAAGSVAGTVLAGFVLLETVGAAGLAGAVALLWLGLGVAVLPWRRMPMARAGLAGCLVVAAVLPLAMLRGQGVCRYESRYTCIRLLDRALPGGGLLRFMILDEGVHSASDRDHPQHLHLGYAALTDRLARAALTRAGNPRALVIGGGGATLPRAWAAMAPAVDVTSIELDPVVARVAAVEMWAAAQSRLTTVTGDGRAVVRAMPAAPRFDVVLMDAYRTRSVPPHLVSREFGAMVAARMTGQGVFLSNVIDRSGTPLLALAIARTLSESFAAVDLWIADHDAGDGTNVVVAAWKDGATAFRPDAQGVTATVMAAGGAAHPQQVTWRRIDVKARARRWPHACAALLTDDWTPVDRLLAGRPVC